MKAFIGVDVGTGSARAGVFDRQGRMLACEKRDIRMWKPQADFVEQSSDDIWQAVCHCVRTAVRQSGLPPAAVGGIGFDATCSLVILDAQGNPIGATPGQPDGQNVIVWMDHRAIPQANRINATGHPVLKYVGGVISPEMQTPKLLWLKEENPRAWARAAQFFDLPDFLTWRATGDDTRSLCSTACKWTYLGHEGDGGTWDRSYFESIGLGELAQEDFRRIGRTVRPLGGSIGQGLTPRAADELGLPAGTMVGVSIIDAHAGGVGMIGCAFEGRRPEAGDWENRLALIGGTSSCHMAVSRAPMFIPGVWGPYYSAMVPGRWLSEGGQSATGSLIDHVIRTHAASAELEAIAASSGKSTYEILNERLSALAQDAGTPGAELTRDLHVCPYFHGNRSPRADPSLRGMISGLKLSATLDDLARLYLATIQAIAYGTRHIIEEMNRAGFRIDTLFTCGGGTKNPLFLREHADITGCRLVLPREPEAVLLGSAILGAAAAGTLGSITDAMSALSHAGAVQPPDASTAAYHARKYRIFHELYQHQIAYRAIMGAAP